MPQPVTKDTTVHEALERVPGAEALFEEHGVKPAPQCGPMIRVLRLRDTPAKCHVQDLDQLIDRLNNNLSRATEGKVQEEKAGYNPEVEV